ncbi:MAG: tetratricopeptide repeat protein [Planctomycetota bacterium]
MFQKVNLLELAGLQLSWVIGVTEIMWMLMALFQVLIVMAIAFRLSLAMSPTVVCQTLPLSRGMRRQASPAVEITGRREGLFAFLLGLVGLSPVFNFTVTGLEARVDMTSLLGQQIDIIPLRNVSTVAAGTRKPIDALLIGAVLVAITLFAVLGLALAGEFASMFLFLVLGGVISGALILYYYWGKRFFLRIVSHSGSTIHLSFKPNVLEGVELDLKRVETLVAVVRDLVLDAVGSSTLSSGGDSFGGPPQLPGGKAGTAWEDVNGFEEVEPFTELPKMIDPDEQAKKMLANAKALSQSGQREQAVQMMRDVIETYPRTAAADQARASLKKHGYL